MKSRFFETDKCCIGCGVPQIESMHVVPDFCCDIQTSGGSELVQSTFQFSLSHWYVLINHFPIHGFSCAFHSWHCWRRLFCFWPVCGDTVFHATELKTCRKERRQLTSWKRYKHGKHVSLESRTLFLQISVSVIKFEISIFTVQFVKVTHVSTHWLFMLQSRLC